MALNAIDVIADELERAHGGDPWHGPSTRAVLSGLTAEQAAARPIENAHSVWELLLHMKAWKREVTERLLGPGHAEPEGGPWPAVGEASATCWQAALDAHAQAHAMLMDSVRAFPRQRLHEAPVGGGITYELMLHGLAQHDAYHTGQVALLAKLLR